MSQGLSVIFIPQIILIIFALLGARILFLKLIRRFWNKQNLVFIRFLSVRESVRVSASPD